jgi:hypothetical protein
VRKWWGEFTGTPLNETGVVVEVEVLAAGELAGWLHIVEGLQHCLHKLVLGGDQLFKVNIVVGVVVVVAAAGLAIALDISCVHHLMVW